MGLLEDKASYVIGEQQLTVVAPYVVKISAWAPPTFLNIGTQPLLCAFSDNKFTYQEVWSNRNG